MGDGELTVVNAYDEIGVSREFTLLGFVPSVTEISYTMPKPGNVIRLTGVNLYDKAKVFSLLPQVKRKASFRVPHRMRLPWMYLCRKVWEIRQDIFV